MIIASLFILDLDQSGVVPSGVLDFIMNAEI